MAACARREALEETGLAVDPARVAFIAETLGPGSPQRAVDLVFLAGPGMHGDPVPAEPGLDARFVPLTALPGLNLRPPLAGHLRALHARDREPTAAYLGNLWRGSAATAQARCRWRPGEARLRAGSGRRPALAPVTGSMPPGAGGPRVPRARPRA